MTVQDALVVQGSVFGGLFILYIMYAFVHYTVDSTEKMPRWAHVAAGISLAVCAGSLIAAGWVGVN